MLFRYDYLIDNVENWELKYQYATINSQTSFDGKDPAIPG
jgi:hypothetical protein